MSDPLELVGVSARYPQGCHAEAPPLANITLSVARGEIVVLLGPNGAGKSTLLRVLAGTVPPSQGTARLFGQDLGTQDRRSTARQVAIVQQREEIAFGFSVRDVVAMGRAPYLGGWMRLHGRDEAIVARVIEQCELGALASRPVSELSGGEQKRVAIARALAQEPKVLLLDEPSASLDVRHEMALYDRLVEESARGVSSVVVMHDLNVAAQYATRVVLMKGGRMVAQGTVADVMTEARLNAVFEATLASGVSERTGGRFFLPLRRGA